MGKLMKTLDNHLMKHATLILKQSHTLLLQFNCRRSCTLLHSEYSVNLHKLDLAGRKR